VARRSAREARIVGTKRLFADGKFGSKDGKAHFMATEWRGLQAERKQEEKDKFTFLINNGRTNHVWQSAYLDQQNDFVMDRWPLPFIEMNPDDMSELNLKNGDLVEVFNDNGSTQAMVYPTPTAKRKQTFMLLPSRTVRKATSYRKVSTSSSFPTTSRPGPTSGRSPTRRRWHGT
jgi:arsenite oxidase large subunit